MTTAQLAIDGGAPAVSRRYRERWRSVHLRDLAAIYKFPHLHRAPKIEWRADGNFPWIAAQS